MSAEPLTASTPFIKAFTVLVLLLSTGALLNLFTPAQTNPPSVPNAYDLVEGSPWGQVIWSGIYGITFLLILSLWKPFIHRFATKGKLLALLVGLAPISALWSAAPEVTLRRSIALIGTTLIGAYLATRFSLSELLWLLAWALGIAALLSLVTVLVIPDIGIDYGDLKGSYRGIYGGGKNHLGRAMSLGALTFLLLALSGSRPRWIVWGGFGLTISLLVLSNSQTSLVTFLAILPLLLAFRALNWHYTLTVFCFIMLVIAGLITAFWVSGNWEGMLGLMDRDATFSQRTNLWPAVVEMIWQRPWLGYGYGAFWLGWEGESAHVWLWNSAQHLKALHAHNGLLDLWLNLGLLGILAFMCSYLLAISGGIRCLRVTNAVEWLWPLAFLMLMLLYNITESSILTHNNIFWLLYVTVVLSTGVPSSKGRFIGLSRAEGTAAKKVRGLSPEVS